jgi:4-hydroxybenzoate polyprenyltransferase
VKKAVRFKEMISRDMIYLKEMFPIAAMMGTFITASVMLNLMMTLNHGHLDFIHFIAPSLGMVCFSLLVRVMDEFKDYEDDLVNFPERPLPSGKIKKKDLKIIWFSLIFISLFCSLTSLPAFYGWLAVMVYSHVMYKWFFFKKYIKPNLPLAFITHHPIIFVQSLYLGLFLFGLDDKFNFSALIHILPYSLLFTNWEFSRKLRSPAEETAYTTYSKVFGHKRAGSLALSCQICVLLTFYFTLDALQISKAWFLTLLPFVGGMIKTFLYMINPNKNSGLTLRKWSETQILNIFIVLGVILWS